jgi:hypothetical protein
MFAISDIAPGGQQPSATQLQMQVIASIANAQRVVAAKSSDHSSDAGMQGSGGRPDSSKLLREAVQRAGVQRAKSGASEAEPVTAELKGEAAARSIIEAQEQSETATTITAAFQARYAITDLLSVIRDPEDKMLPKAPSEHAD